MSVSILPLFRSDVPNTSSSCESSSARPYRRYMIWRGGERGGNQCLIYGCCLIKLLPTLQCRPQAPPKSPNPETLLTVANLRRLFRQSDEAVGLLVTLQAPGPSLNPKPCKRYQP